MIYLFATTDILRTNVSNAAAVHVQVNYVKTVKATGVVSDMLRGTNVFAGAGDYDIAGPGGTDAHSIKQGTWWNADASLVAPVTIYYRFTGSPTNVTLFQTTLQPGEGICYIEGAGFYAVRPAAPLDKVIMMPNDSVHSLAVTFADIAGMTYPLLSGKKYSIKATLFHTNDASTTGSRFAYNIGAAPTLANFGEWSPVTNSATAAVVSTGTATARDTAIVAQTTGQTALGHTIIEGMIQPSADGTFAMRASSEIAVTNGLVVKAGSILEIRQER